ncbi:MAG: RagB/SusD family nutrient uptake outer membrane protein [Bacteroidota bacterium]
MKKISISFILLCLIAGFFQSCTDLEEQLNDGVPTLDANADVAQLLAGAYGNLRDLQSQEHIIFVANHTTDEMAGPTRGRDWDDAGIWRVLHRHSWTPSHQFIEEGWRTLNRNGFNAQQVLCNGATGQVAAEATFLRVFADYMTLDLFGKVPRRACNENLLNPPSQLLTRENGVELFISELEAVFNDLPTSSTSAATATQDAARVLLAKLYLNRAVHAATGADGAPQAGPYTFDAADMNKVVELCDEIIGSGSYALDDNYFDNFIPENTSESSELIFVSENSSGGASGNVRSRWFCSTHYNQNPSGWNGFVALSDLYDKFEETDVRRGQDLDYIGDNGSGLRAGFLIGQQFASDGTPLEDRQGGPLNFTSDFNLFQTGDQLEVTGIRCVKYPPDFTTPGDNSDNDFIFFRYADILLMKAEAILRGGSSPDRPEDLVNSIRTIRGASTFGSVDLQTVLDERSRELYWECWRRNDQIRFNTYLGTWQEKPNPSDPSRLLFPIPAEAIATNPNLPQNPGY